MLIQYNNLLPLRCLRNISKINNIKYTSQFSKNKLISFLNENNASKIIQRYIRNKLMTDNTCPITHEKLRYPFICIKLNSKFFYYDFHTFVKYLNVSDENRDPCTRLIISDIKLNEINKLIRYYYGKNTKKIIISQNMIKNTELNIILYCLYDLISEITNIDYISLDNIYDNILPRFIYYIHILVKNHSKEDCLTIINSCKRSLIELDKMNCILVLDYLNLITALKFNE
jgi:hypothetical protein